MKAKEITYTNIFGQSVTISTRKQNPMLKAYGPGPTDKKCKDCIFLIVREMSRKFFKCKLRKMTHGPATDHRANWPTCKRFIETQNVISGTDGDVQTGIEQAIEQPTS